MTTETTETTEPLQSVLKQLADLTNRLPDDQATVIATFVDAAYEEPSEDAPPSEASSDGDSAPSDDAFEAAVAELFALRESMSDEEQAIVDAMVEHTTTEEPEVVGHWWQHRFKIQVPGFGTGQTFYRNMCNRNQRSASGGRYGIGAFRMHFGRFTTTYNCWVWRGR